MKLRQVEFVVAIARTTSFSHAADLCNATQPTLSAALGQIEDELGGKLFRRTTRKVELTPFGQHMLPALQAVLAARDEAASMADSYLHPARKLLRIGLSPLVDMRRVEQAMAPFRAARPEVEVFFKECLLGDLSERIAAGGIDMAILPQDVVPEGLDQRPFYSEPMCYLPSGGTTDEIARTPGARLAVTDLPGDPIITTGGGCGLNRTLDVLLAAERVDVPRYLGQALSYHLIQEWSWLGLGAAILPASKLATQDAAHVLLCRSDGRRAEFGFCWAWQREVRDLDHIASFLDMLRRET